MFVYSNWFGFTSFMIRAYVGPYVTWGKVLHVYLGYDPIVYSKIAFTDNDHVNPFMKDAVLKGYAFGQKF